MTSHDTGSDMLLCEIQDRVATITLNRPDARNALHPDMTTALRHTLDWARTSDEVGAVVLTGAGAAFCSGGDVKAMGRSGSSGQSAPELQAQFQALSERHHATAGVLRAMRKPTIAALPGPAAGAGMALALACDLRVMADHTFMTTGYAGIGLSGDYGIAWLLTRVVGPGRARELLLTGQRINADQALAIGLVTRVTDSNELLSATGQLAGQLANGPSVAYGYIKDNLDEALNIDHATAIDREADRLLKARSTADHREAVRAFTDKRPPQFSGR